MKIIGDKSLSVINLGAAACAAASATDIVTTGGAGLATLAATGALAKAVGAEHRNDFERYIKKAQKAAEVEIAQNAFITGEATQEDIDATYSALSGAIKSVNPTVKDFSDWGLDPQTVADGLVSRFVEKRIAPFATNTAAQDIAKIIIFAAFNALKTDHAFWKRGDIWVKEAVFARLDRLLAGQQKILDALPNSIADSPFIRRIGRSKLTTFRGHDGYVLSLHEQLSTKGSAAAVTQAATAQAIAGMGGLGKTTLAAEYAHKYGTSDNYAGVWWVNAESGVEQGLAELAAKIPPLQGLGNQSIKAQARAVLDYLSAQARPWLLIYDNVESPDAITDLRPSGQTRLIITSRHPDWTGIAEPAPLNVWNNEVTAQYLIDITQRDDEAGAKTLAELLGGLPLAADQAASFLRQKPNITFEKYASDINILLAKERKHKGDYPDTVYATISKSLADLPQATIDLLCLISWLSPDGVDLELLKWDLQGEPYILPETLRHTLADDYDSGDMIAAARDLSLIRTEGDSDAVTLIMHRITGEVLRHWQDNNDDAAAWDDIATHLIFTVYPSGNAAEDTSIWEPWKPLLPHARNFATLGPSDGEGGTRRGLILNSASSYLIARGDVTGAIALLEAAVELAREIGGEKSEGYRVSLSNLSGRYTDVQRYEEAEASYLKVIKIEEELFSSDHPNLAIRRHNLGEVYYQQKQFDKAEEQVKRALDIEIAHYGKISHNAASSQNALGAIYDDWAEQPGQAHRREQAKGLNQQAIDTARQVRGERHPKVSQYLHNLSILYERLEDLKKAVELERRASAIMLSLDLIEHPLTLQRLNVLHGYLEKAGAKIEPQALLSFVVPDILTVEVEMLKWVKADPDNRHFGPPSFFADKPEWLEQLRPAMDDS